MFYSVAHFNSLACFPICLVVA